MTAPMRLVELFTDRLELSPFECGDTDFTPCLAGADERGIHQLQHRTLAEGVGDDLRPPPLLAEEPLEQVRRADYLAVRDRERCPRVGARPRGFCISPSASRSVELVRGGDGLARSARPTGEIVRSLPDDRVDWKLGEDCLVVSQSSPFLLVADARPDFQADHRIPRCFSRPNRASTRSRTTRSPFGRI